MALDRQRILGELGSVMNQLQNADCGCLGKLFGNSQQTPPPMMGSPLPTCGGCRRACCHGHGYAQPSPNMNYASMEGPNSSPQPMSGNMHGFGPQIVNMMRGDHANRQNMTGPAQGHMQGQLTGPMVIDAPQSPHGKIGLTPFTPSKMVPRGHVNPATMNQGDIAGQMQNQFIPQSNNNTGNVANMNPWTHQNVSPNSPVHQMATPQTNAWPQQSEISNPKAHQMTTQSNAWPQQSMVSNPTAHQMATPQMNAWQQHNMTSNPRAHQTSMPHSNPHGQHSEGIAKFNKMFPGVKQGLGGDLGFDPMAIAIQMNPDNHLQSAMDTMNKIMNGNKGMDQMFNKPAPANQPGIAGNTVNQSSPVVNGMIQQNASPDQVAQSNVAQIGNQLHTAHNMVPNQELPSKELTNASAYGQPILQQNHQMYAGTVDANATNKQIRQDDTKKLGGHQQYGQQQIVDLNSAVSNLPAIQHEAIAEGNQLEAPHPESNGYPNQALPRQQIIKEPIFPVDTSKNLTYMPTKQQRTNNYGYNTLGQPVEMLPAKMYHPPEPNLPQTLSPQPDTVKPKSGPQRFVNLKATVSKTSLMGNKQVGKTPSRAQLQHIYNQYKGSQSFTHQNLRHPNEGTYSDGRLNVPQPTNAPPVPIERVGGDTVVNNPHSNQDRINKIEPVMGHIGDVPVAKPAGDSLPAKDAHVSLQKCRNGLQDMVFSSYPTSTAWTFHGHGRNDNLPPQRFRHRYY